MTFQEGQQLGEYEIVQPLGGMDSSAVYKARHGTSGRMVVLRFLDPSLRSDAENVGRFHRDAAAAVALKHPGLVEVYGSGEVEGWQFVVMEFVADETVSSWMRRKGRVGPENAIAIGLYLASALGYAWNEASLIHDDINPANIFVSRDGGVKLGAFGLSADGYGGLSARAGGIIRRASRCLSPEQARGDANIDLRANIYGIGCVLYQMLCGRPSSDGEEVTAVALKTTSEPLPYLRNVWPEFPRVLADVIGRALEKDPRARYQSFDELSDALRLAYDSLSDANFPETPPAQQTSAVVETAVDPTISPDGSAVGLPVTSEPKRTPVNSAPGHATNVRRKRPFGIWIAVAVTACVVSGTVFYLFRWKKTAGGTDAEALESPPGLPKADAKKPFVNTLGMPFVPVRGAKVLVCIWETRVKDYVAFAQSNQVSDAWTKQEYRGTPVAREAEHPVCGVSWDDADAFCKWLTEKETAEGKLIGGAHYRLPTDVEWSRAVGLRTEEGSTPKERSGKNGADYPWGKFWPPLEKAGSYADAVYHEKYPKERAWLEGYTDGFAETAPVGSFPANEFGIHDLGGNVWEWCGDLYEAGKKERVLRGASWDDSGHGYLLSSYRIYYPPASRYSDYGFRCVLATREN